MDDLGALPFFVAFPLIWVGVVTLIARFGGWARLAREYPGRPQLGGRRFRFRSGRMRFQTGYGSCLTLGSDPMGLHLEILFLFRPGHPAIFVPWSDVSVREDPGRARRNAELRFQRAPEVPLVVGRRLARELADASSGAFAVPEAQRGASGSARKR